MIKIVIALTLGFANLVALADAVDFAETENSLIADEDPIRRPRKSCNYTNSDEQCQVVHLGDPCFINGALGVCASAGSTGEEVNCRCASNGPPVPPPPPAPVNCIETSSAISCRFQTVGGPCNEMRRPGVCYVKLMIGSTADCGCL